MSKLIGYSVFAVLAAGLWCIGAVVGQAPPSGPDDLLEQTRRLNEVAAQKLEAETRDAMSEAKRLSPASPARSLEVLKKALAQLEKDTILSPSRRDTLKAALKYRIRAADDDARRDTQLASDQSVKQAQTAGRRAEEERRRAEEDRVAAAVRSVRALQSEGRYDEARRLADDLARRYPNNPAITAAGRTTSVGERVADARRLRSDSESRMLGVYRGVEKSALPPLGDIEFPPDWAEKSKMRLKNVNKMSEKETAIFKALGSPISLDFTNQPFEEVIDYLKKTTGLPILLDDASLKELLVRYDTPISIKVKTVSVRTVLRKILGELNLAYVVKDEAVQVMSAVKAREMMTVRSYYIGDLVSNFNLGLPPIINQMQMTQSIQQMIDLVQSSVDPASWQANGGLGTITFDPLTMSLVIKQTAEIHYVLGFGRR